MPRASRAHAGLLLLLAFLLVVPGALHFWVVAKQLMFLAVHGNQDTQIFVAAAQALSQGGRLYGLAEPLYLTYAPGMAVFKFPPLYVLPYLPWLDAIAANRTAVYTALFGFHVVRYLLAMGLVIACLGPRRNPVWWLAVLTVFLWCSPVHDSLYGMTFENLLLCVLVLVLVLLQRGWHWLAAALLSYVMLAKLYPVAQVLFFATRERWRMLPLLAVTGAGWLLLAVGLLGSEAHWDYYGKILPVLLQEDANVGWLNTSLFYSRMPAGTLRSVTVLAVPLLTVLLLAATSRRDGPRDYRLQFCFVLPVMLLVMKNCWVNYQIVLLLPIVLLVASALETRNGLRAFKWLVAIAAAVPLLQSVTYPGLELPHYQWLQHQPWGDALVAGLQTGRLYSPLLLWAGIGTVLAWEAWRHPPVPSQG